MYDLLIEPLAAYKLWIDLSAALATFVAAGFWLRASLIKAPKEVWHAFHIPSEGPLKGDVPEAIEALAKQSRLNSFAAGFAALAAVLTGISTLIGTRWG